MRPVGGTSIGCGEHIQKPQDKLLLKSCTLPNKATGKAEQWVVLTQKQNKEEEQKLKARFSYGKVVFGELPGPPPGCP